MDSDSQTEGVAKEVGGTVSGTDGSPQALKIPTALEAQLKSIGGLADAIERLEARLVPSVVSPITESKGEATKPEQSPRGVAETIAVHNQEIRQLRSRINSLLDRLEV